MSLPLDDTANPLYKQSVVAQINRITNWQQYFPSARALFSISAQYTNKDVVAAYHQLAIRFHPDKNPENPAADNAFKLINLAKEMLEFELLSTTEQREEFERVVNNPFLTAESQYKYFGANSGFGNPYTQGHGTVPKEDFNNPSLYKDQGFSAILAVLERGRKAVELQEGLHDFCPFKLPSAGKEQLATLMAQGSTTESINIVAWLNLCRYQDDFDFFQQLCDYMLNQKHQTPLAQIKDFLPKYGDHSDNTTLINHLFAVIDARTAHFVMSQLSRFIDIKTQDELLNYFKDWQFNAVREHYRQSYHVTVAFLGWHSSSESLRKELQEHIKREYCRNLSWQVRGGDNDLLDKELYFDKDNMWSFKSKSPCHLSITKEKQNFSTLISVLREQGVLTVSEGLYVASYRNCLDELSTILSQHPQLPLNSYYLLYNLMNIDVLNLESKYDRYTFKRVVLPGRIENTRENVITCSTQLFKQILAYARLSPEQLTELFLFLLENNDSSDIHIANFILELMDDYSLTDALQKKIWLHCIKTFTYYQDSTFLDRLIKQASPLFFDSIPLHNYLFRNAYKPELITKIVNAAPRFVSCHYNNMPVMTGFVSYTFFTSYRHDDKYSIGTVNGLYLHHSLTNICVYGVPSTSKACAIIEAMRAKDYALFNVDLEIPIYTNSKQHDVYQWFYNEPLLRHSCCNAMHIAAIRGLDEELLAMLEKGGNYHKKASVWRKSSYFGIETLILEQKSSYQYAKEQHLPKSCRWILQQELKDYIQGREKEDNYTTRLSLCGYTLWNGGYNREDKLYGAEALLHLIESTHFVGFGQDLSVANDLSQVHPALTQGRLGALFDTYKKLCRWHEEEQKTKTGTHYYWDDKPAKVLYANKRGFNDLSSNNKFSPIMN
ncbi:J domain-containing protein [uncultured Legionella sp.]|uniref:J domain-containing protein n=1 Tax=uncultured Legionella sp. TaxID=210934 RepID=UPI002635D0EE|nr:J domain-containing protein [uncultured Legionella sp.]